MSVRVGVTAMLLLGSGLALAPPRASAQPEALQRARALFEETAFEDALAVLDAVRDDAGFTRDDAIEWVVLRARLASAEGDDALVVRELARLAQLTDDVALPPDLRARFDALEASTPDLEVSLRWEDGALEAITIDDPVLVREVRVSARDAGAADDAPPRTGVGRLAIAAPSDCRADVIGPGGAVLASATGCPASARATASADAGAATDQGGGDDGVWIAIGVTAGVLALAAGGVALGVVLSAEPQDVEVRSVMVRW